MVQVSKKLDASLVQNYVCWLLLSLLLWCFNAEEYKCVCMCGVLL